MSKARMLISAMLVVLMGVLAPMSAYAASAEEDVSAAYAAWDEAFNKGDAKAVAAFYTDDAKFLPATHDVIEGPAGVEKFFTGIFGMGVTGHKIELIEAHGGDPFAEYSLPEAILRLRQGVGRLIRTAQDRGIVVILDPRVLTKSYGQAFLRAAEMSGRDRVRPAAIPPTEGSAPSLPQAKLTSRLRHRQRVTR